MNAPGNSRVKDDVKAIQLKICFCFSFYFYLTHIFIEEHNIATKQLHCDEIPITENLGSYKQTLQMYYASRISQQD